MHTIDIFPWNEHFNTGLPEVDQQHQRLVQLLNQLASHMAFGSDIPHLNVVFDELTNYTIYHFQIEESIWNEFLSADKMEIKHKETHEVFVQTILRLKNDHESKPSRKVVEETIAFLARWLASHILENDRHLACVVLALKSGLSLEDAKQRAVEQMSGATRVLIEIILSIYETLSTNTLNLMRKLVEHESEEERYRVVFQTTTDAINITDAEDSRYVEVNEAFTDITGYMREEVVGRTGIELNLWANPSDRLKLAVAVLQEGKIRNQEVQFLRKNGERFWGLISVTKLQLRGRQYYLSVTRDITDRKLAESALEESEARFRRILERAPVGMATTSVDGRILLVNQSFCDMLGYTREELVKLTFQDITHPEDRKLTLPERKRLLDGDLDTYQLEKRYLHKNGQVVWGLLTSSIERNNFDAPPYFISQVENITERKQAEQSLRITASVFDNSQEAILITDASNFIVDVNPAFTRITGYSREEVLGRNPKLLSSGRQDKGFYAAMWQQLNLSRSWRGEIWNRRKSGEFYAEQLSISTIFDNLGKVLRYVAVFSDITHIKEHEAELRRVAHYDALTGIPNRVLLADRMKQAIAQSVRERNIMVVCYLDLDGFKPINDTLGHKAGDQVLIEVAKRIGHTIRGGDTVSRLGGDEFVVLLLGLDRAEECMGTLERLLATIAEPIIVNDVSSRLSTSIGVSIFPLDDEDPDTLLRHADQAMYIAKQNGKNRYHIYDPELDLRARNQRDFLKTIHTALEQGQFELYYQPKVNLRTKKLVGAEALIRWHHPERGLLLPAEFLHLVENTDLDIEIGEWVTATALAQLNHWLNTGLDIEVSINISGYHLESSRFTQRLQQQLSGYPDLQMGQLQVEVLETVALNDITVVREIISACHQFGVGFALDDFGTGYSSLSYLNSLPFDVLKIDQSFIRDMLENKGDMAIVQGIIALARAFNRETVAEGIETKEQYQKLREMGCALGQGYFIAHPMSADELTKWKPNFCI